MVAYADYDYYESEYLGGAIDKEDFPRLALRASEDLDDFTQGAIPDPVPDAVRRACCALAEFILQEENGGPKAGESVGGYSVNYAVSSVNVAASEVRKYQVARRYLLNTGLLYRGGRGQC